MKDKQIKNDLREVYNDIASDFSHTRVYPWQELQVFIPYIKDNFKILDLGCGNGRLLKSFTPLDKKIHYLGLDFSEELIDKAKTNHPGAKFIVADMLEADFNPDSFDMVFMIAAFHHIPTKRERLELLYKINRWLKPGGYLFMTNWNLWQRRYIKYALEKFWSKHSWKDFFIPWRSDKDKVHWRYYHSFGIGELTWLLNKTHFELNPEGVYKTKYNINAFVKKPKK